MKLNIKKVALILISIFLFTGCNLYRQMATPRHCYSSNYIQTTANANQAYSRQVATSTSCCSDTENNTVITESSYNGTIYATSEVKQYEVATRSKYSNIKYQNHY